MVNSRGFQRLFLALQVLGCFLIKVWLEKDHSLIFILFAMFLYSVFLALSGIAIGHFIDVFIHKRIQNRCIFMKDALQTFGLSKVRKFFNKEGRQMKRLIKEAQKDLTPKGAGVTCMIQGKYSREYTDYYLNQLAEFFGFDFFHNKKEEIISKLKPNQKFKSMQEILLEKHNNKSWCYEHIQFCVDKSYIYAKHCENGIVSKELFEDMMFFDGLIMNNKRSFDNFGFIVDKEKKDTYGEDFQYSFVCFYDEYNSIFDHLNGLNRKQAHNVRNSLSSWIDNDVSREFIEDTMSMYAQERHLNKMTKFLISTKVWKFKDNTQFQITEPTIEDYKDTKLSIFDFHVQLAFEHLPPIRKQRLILEECLFNHEKFNEYLKDVPQTKEFQKLLKKEFYKRKLTELRQNPKINPRKKLAA